MRRFLLHWLTLVSISIQSLASTQLFAWIYKTLLSGWITWNICKHRSKPQYKLPEWVAEPSSRLRLINLLKWKPRILKECSNKYISTQNEETNVPLKQDFSPGTRNKILFLKEMIYKQLVSTCWLGLSKICCQPQGSNFSNAAAPSFGWLEEGTNTGLKGNASQQEAEKRNNESLDPAFGAAFLLLPYLYFFLTLQHDFFLLLTSTVLHPTTAANHSNAFFSVSL